MSQNAKTRMDGLRRRPRFPTTALSMAIGAAALATGCLSAGWRGPRPGEGNDAGTATDGDVPALASDAGVGTDAAAPPSDAGPGWGFITCSAQDNCEVPFESCQICDPGDTVDGTCIIGDWPKCANWGVYPPVLMHCDGDEDCAGEETCRILEGSLGTYVQCLPLVWCSECTCGGTEVCETLADCPPCATVCEQYQYGHAVSVCRTL